MNDADDTLAALRSLMAPPVRSVEMAALPPARRRMCPRCPFGTGLTRREQDKANALKAQLAEQPHRLWGCHETIDDNPLICAGFAATRQDLFPTEGE